MNEVILILQLLEYKSLLPSQLRTVAHVNWLMD